VGVQYLLGSQEIFLDSCTGFIYIALSQHQKEDWEKAGDFWGTSAYYLASIVTLT